MPFFDTFKKNNGTSSVLDAKIVEFDSKFLLLIFAWFDDKLIREYDSA